MLNCNHAERSHWREQGISETREWYQSSLTIGKFPVNSTLILKRPLPKSFSKNLFLFQPPLFKTFNLASKDN